MTTILKEGRVYRLGVRVPLTHTLRVRSSFGQIMGQKMVLKDVSSRIEALGFDKPKAVIQDPSDQRVFTVIAKKRRHQPKMRTRSLAHIATATEVDDRSESLLMGEHPALDPGLSPEEVETVAHILESETNPRHMDGFATTLEPFFPYASTLIRARGLIFEARREHLISDEEAERATSALRNYLTGWRSYMKSPLTSPMMEMARQNFLRFVYESKTPIEVAQDEVRRAACLIAAKNISMESLSQFNDSVIELAALLLDEILPGISIVNPRKMMAALPPTGSEGFVSPSALQLVMAVTKPDLAGVQNAEEARKIYEILLGTREAAEPLDAVTLVKAQSQVERATRALERRRWIEWYRKMRLLT